MTMLLGFAVAVFFVGYKYKRHSIYWNHLERVYGRTWNQPTNERWGNAVLFGDFPIFKSYNGTLKIGVDSEGLALRTMFPLDAIFCQPLFIPFGDIIGWDGTWYINSKTVHLKLKRTPSIKIAIPLDQFEWIRSKSGMKQLMMRETPLHKTKPAVWYIIFITALTLPISILVIIYFLLAKGLL